MNESITELQNALEQCTSALAKAEKANTENSALLAHTGRLAALGEMITSVAHELNQPLSIIRTNMQTLEFLSKDSLPPKDLIEILNSTIRQVDRATNIINHMRTFARKQSSEAEKIDISLPIESALSLFNEQFRLHSITIIRNFEKDLPPLYVEKQQMEQLFVNLLSNAHHAVESMHSKIGSKFEMRIMVNLKYNKEKQHILFEMCDNGIGMTPDQVACCRDPFFTTKEEGKGTGLGLAIVDNTIKMLNGQVEILSEPDEGTTIRILFPIDDKKK